MCFGKKLEKYGWAVEKHRQALQGTGYEKCAECSGTTGRLNADGLMLCSNINGVPIPVTLGQIDICDGTKPPPYVEKRKKPRHKPHPIFRSEHRI